MSYLLGELSEITLYTLRYLHYVHMPFVYYTLVTLIARLDLMLWSVGPEWQKPAVDMLVYYSKEFQNILKDHVQEVSTNKLQRHN
jgi:hypothetical protein